VAHLGSQSETPWNAPADEIQKAQDFVSNELVISGVYVRLFIANPGWVLRKPREFLSDLLEKGLQNMQSTNPNLEELETITIALVSCEIIFIYDFRIKAKDEKKKKNPNKIL
jgi:DnaJ family protein C protein 13